MQYNWYLKFTANTKILLPSLSLEPVIFLSLRLHLHLFCLQAPQKTKEELL